MENIRYIIYSPEYNPKRGGVIALHFLSHLLNNEQEKAYLYFKPNYLKTIELSFKAIMKFLGYKKNNFLDYKYLKYGLKEAIGKSFFKRNKEFNTPLFSDNINENDIVIYPEITEGNPLNAKKVIRWFLHKPGFHKKKVEYGSNELYFYYQKVFNDSSINNSKNMLRIILFRDDIFFNKKHTRKGSCYLIKKGLGKEIQHDLSDSILMDEMSLKQMSKTFNSCEYFYSYDTQTMYSRYAVICGCKSIVIPDQGVSKEEWQPEEELRYGIAYGIEDLENAEKTKDLFFKKIEAMKKENKEMVQRFIVKSKYFFFRQKD